MDLIGYVVNFLKGQRRIHGQKKGALEHSLRDRKTLVNLECLDLMNPLSSPLHNSTDSLLRQESAEPIPTVRLDLVVLEGVKVDSVFHWRGREQQMIETPKVGFVPSGESTSKGYLLIETVQFHEENSCLNVVESAIPTPSHHLACLGVSAMITPLAEPPSCLSIVGYDGATVTQAA